MPGEFIQSWLKRHGTVATVFIRLDMYCAWTINQEKPEKTTSSVSQLKLYRATSGGDRWYYRRAKFVQEVVVGTEGHDFGDFLSKYVKDIA